MASFEIEGLKSGRNSMSRRKSCASILFRAQGEVGLDCEEGVSSAMVDDDAPLIALVARSPPTEPKRTKYKVEARVDIDGNTWSRKKMVASVAHVNHIIAY